MSRDKSAATVDVGRIYDSSDVDLNFAALLAFIDAGDDAALAELIEADGRQRLRRKRPVTLQRYFQVVPDLIDRQDPLDAAIDVALRSLSAGSRVTPGAVDHLLREYPQLAAAIHEAAALNAAIWSTTGLRRSVSPLPSKTLPCDFGPVLSTGERRYVLEQLLGQGAFGQVYLARDRQLSETGAQGEGHNAMVAIKIIASPEGSIGGRSSLKRQRLIDEAAKVRRISHPNVVMVLDRGVTESDEDYIVYEYVDGGDLSQIVAALDSAAGPDPMAIERAVQIVRDTALGVHAAHAAGVIHCDLKPGNIMLTSTGQPKVADFGIAVRLDEGAPHHAPTEWTLPKVDVNPQKFGPAPGGKPVGNIAFISPEQYRGEDGTLSIPSDVYALGGILYLLLTGSLPNGSSIEEIAATHHRTSGRKHAPSPRLLRPQIDRDLDAICRRAMAVQPGDRYSSAAALAEDLQHWLDLEPIAWLRPSVLRVMRLWSRRKPALAALVAAVIVLVVAGSLVALHFASLAHQRELEARQHEYEKSIAQIKFQEEEARVAHVKRITTTLRNSMAELRNDYRFNTDALTIVWTFEYILGPHVLGMPDEQAEFWKQRVQIIRRLVQGRHETGRADELETLLWESALAFWLVSDGDYAEAQPLLAANHDKWTRILAPSDTWLTAVRAMLACADVNKLTDPNAADRPQLAEVESRLSKECQAIDASHRGTAMHLLLLRKLAQLYGPDLLNNPDRQAQVQAEHQQLLDGKKKEGAARRIPM